MHRSAGSKQLDCRNAALTIEMLQFLGYLNIITYTTRQNGINVYMCSICFNESLVPSMRLIGELNVHHLICVCVCACVRNQITLNAHFVEDK